MARPESRAEPEDREGTWDDGTDSRGEAVRLDVLPTPGVSASTRVREPSRPSVESPQPLPKPAGELTTRPESFVIIDTKSHRATSCSCGSVHKYAQWLIPRIRVRFCSFALIRAARIPALP